MAAGRLVAGRYRLPTSDVPRGRAAVARDEHRGRDVDVARVATLPALVAALRGVEHPGVPALLDAVADQGQLLVVVERPVGILLVDLLEAPLLAAQDAVWVLAELADVVQALHLAGGTHGAISPATVVLEAGLPRLGGLADRVAAAAAGTDGLDASGFDAPRPDAAAGGAPDVAHDVGALAETGWHLLAGAPPPPVPTAEDLVAARQAVPEHVARTLAATLLGDGPPSAGAFAHALRDPGAHGRQERAAATAEQLGAGRAAVGPSPPPEPPRPVDPRWWQLAAVLLLVLAVAVVVAVG